MDKNKELHELLGLCWHEVVPGTQLWLQTSNRMSFVCSKCRERYIESFCLDYAADPRLVLREMAKRKDWDHFFENVLVNHTHLSVNSIPVDSSIQLMLFPLYLIIDTTGKLRDIAISWLKEIEV